MTAFPSDRDQNFLLTTGSGQRFVVKISNADETQAVLDFQNKLMTHLGRCRQVPRFPQPCDSKSGEPIRFVSDGSGTRYFVRVLTYVPGKRLVDVKPHPPDLLRNIGQALALMDASLQTFSHPAAKRNLIWDLQRAPEVVRKYAGELEPGPRRALVESFLLHYERSALPHLGELRRSVIHNDANDYNLLVKDGLWQKEVVGIIDFGDAVYSHTVNELAIATAYAILAKRDPISAAAHVVAGYHRTLALTESEIQVLFHLICMRLCVSVCMAAYQKKQEPDMTYLTVTEQPAWETLEKLREVSPQFATCAFRHACGLPPCPHSGKIVSWLLANRDQVGRVVEPDLQSAANVVFDLSVESSDGLVPSENRSTAELTAWLFDRLGAAGVEVGIGRYNEARQVYTAQQFKTAGGEWRTIHIGLDIFMAAGSPIFAPLAGKIHSFKNNTAWRDYGPTLIIEHIIESRNLRFFTLYGHLSADSLNGLYKGKPVNKGERIASIGDFPENGDWPPHLHFQIITDMLGKEGDFPGVAPASERDIWLSLCPDPNVLLGIPETCFPKAKRSKQEILHTREKHFAGSLSISYQEPLEIVRGSMQVLVDQTGRAYLDAVNNVPHVGHCHPHVVEAARKQIAVLNTNTRYLHDTVVAYAERLCATLPDALEVCTFVCTGSEANELALRMARAHTGAQDIIVLEGAYHGNTSSLIELSPYKFDGPGGRGAPPYVHKVALPDTYRGKYKSADRQVGEKYAGEVDRVIRVAKRNQRGIAAFFCESILSCAGQIVLPEGYLREAYRFVRQAGGVCVADEIQVGFGRAGSHFWAFEAQGVVPDIVTLGKPMGNGHPLAAVVTTREIAESFDNGMEYFNTFGGNPVSCAIGMAVLDVLENEHLQENARNVGAYLLAGLRNLKEKHPLIGDVRGLGLFLGVELVLRRETLAPAAEQASYIVERMKEHGVLVSTDGPFHNVLKIKPPLVFTTENADLLLDTLDGVLQDSCLRNTQ